MKLKQSSKAYVQVELNDGTSPPWTRGILSDEGSVVMSGHKYTVEFRISGKFLDPHAVTKKLLLQPCMVRLSGARGSGPTRSDTAVWGYDGTDGSEIVEWDSLEDGLSSALDRLWPLRGLIAEYKPDCTLLWWCGHFQSGLNGGPVLSAPLLTRLGEFGAALYVDNYFSPPADPRREN